MEGLNMKCRNNNCHNEKAPDRAECASCRGKRRRGTNHTTKWSSEGPRILFIDIETYPNLVLCWDSQLWTGHISIDQIVEPGGLLCLAAKWYGEDEIIFKSLWDDGADAMVDAVWYLMNEADTIVHYYGSRFDVPHLNSEIWQKGMVPPLPFKQVDLKVAVSRRFKLPSNKLQFVSQVLNIEGKEEHEGFKLWPRVMAGDPDARARMQSYNSRDTELLEECYESLLPWLPDHPHRNLYTGGSECPRCGHENTMQPAGFAYTRLSKYEQFRCFECGSPFRGSKRIAGVGIQDSML
jgi:hypothetical protein